MREDGQDESEDDEMQCRQYPQSEPPPPLGRPAPPGEPPPHSVVQMHELSKQVEDLRKQVANLEAAIIDRDTELLQVIAERNQMVMTAEEAEEQRIEATKRAASALSNVTEIEAALDECKESVSNAVLRIKFCREML